MFVKCNLNKYNENNKINKTFFFNLKNEKEKLLKEKETNN
jgi:hypothetical protein